ncbi:ion transporter [Paenibacillus sp. CAU 1782]
MNLGKFIDSSPFRSCVLFLIFINAILVGLETYPAVYEAYFPWIYWMDRLLLWAFTLEIVLRIAVNRASYFKDGWNVFDFAIVLSGHLFAGGSFVTVLRILRVLRLLRSISVMPSLRRLVNALLMTLPSLWNISLLLSILLYIFAVAGTMMFGHAMPHLFGSLHASLLTLFQIITLDSWSSGMMRPLMEIYPWAWVYFVSFVLFGTFIVMNLIVGVIVTNLDKANAADEPDNVIANEAPSAQQSETSKDQVELAALRADIAELKELVTQLSKKTG